MSRFHAPEQHSTRSVWAAFATLVFGALALYLLFFVTFAESLSSTPKDVPKADGIVVFTGTATSRIGTGLDLLAAQKGRRLLVTGLYEDYRFETILAMRPGHVETIRCCLDLDYKATNTVANTHETALWADIHGFQSLIVVTSAHHMPRAFLELRRAMPTAQLSAYPVVPPQVKLDYWFAYPGTAALLLGEYTRYLWALTGLPGAG